jgi:hypothetical protein
MGWTNVTASIKSFYSKYSPYPDLFCYWNGSDNRSTIHPITRALADNQTIRGPAIFVRAEPPKFGPTVFCSERMQDPSPWTIEIGVKEMMNTLEFYEHGSSFEKIDIPRFQKRLDMHIIESLKRIGMQ